MVSLRSRISIAVLIAGSSTLAAACVPDPGGTPPTTTTVTSTTSTTSTSTTAAPTSTTTTSTTTPVPATWQEEMLADINAKRAAHDVAPLTLCARLTNAARSHSNFMAATRTLSHTGSNGSSPADRVAAAGYAWQAVAENVAFSQTTVTEVMDAFYNEVPPNTGHRDNILNPDFVHVGVARAAASDGLLYWTQDFAAGGPCT